MRSLHHMTLLVIQLYIRCAYSACFGTLYKLILSFDTQIYKHLFNIKMDWIAVIWIKIKA